MAVQLPLTLKLTRAALARHDHFRQLVERARPPRVDAAVAYHAFAFKADEAGFARALLDRHPRLWLFRGNQRASCGDFLIVDMSSPRPAHRTAYVVELKLGAPARVGGGPVGVQLARAGEALAELPGRTADAPVVILTGDGATLAARFTLACRDVTIATLGGNGGGGVRARGLRAR